MGGAKVSPLPAQQGFALQAANKGNAAYKIWLCCKIGNYSPADEAAFHLRRVNIRFFMSIRRGIVLEVPIEVIEGIDWVESMATDGTFRNVAWPIRHHIEAEIE